MQHVYCGATCGGVRRWRTIDAVGCRFYAWVVSFAAVAVAVAGNADAATLKVFVAPRPAGNDQNSGLSVQRPLASLGRVQELLQARGLCTGGQADEVEVHIAPGTYRRQEIHWTCFTGAAITFTALNFDKQRPVFDGGGSTFYWLWAKEPGVEARLRFRYIRVLGYCTAMEFRGVNGVDLYGMYFESIGDRRPLDGAAVTCTKPTAAVAFNNSSRNRVANSHFVKVVNFDAGARAIHALYISHGASNNAIERNRFVEISGDPVKVRDGSNHNRVFANHFHRAGHLAYFLDGFDATRECPSFGNTFSSNHLYGGFKGGISPTHVQHEPLSQEIILRCGKPTVPRVQVADNVIHPST